MSATGSFLIPAIGSSSRPKHSGLQVVVRVAMVDPCWARQCVHDCNITFCDMFRWEPVPPYLSCSHCWSNVISGMTFNQIRKWRLGLRAAEATRRILSPPMKKFRLYLLGVSTSVMLIEANLAFAGIGVPVLGLVVGGCFSSLCFSPGWC